MAALIDENTQFFDETTGVPINNGYVYIGTQGQDPKLNIITIYSDRALATTIANPQRTGADGRVVNKIWVPGRYSIKVEDENNVQKYQELDNGETPASGITSLSNVQGINAITAEASPAITAYADKEIYIFKAASANTGAMTLDAGGGAKDLKKNHDEDMAAGDIKADQVISAIYNSTSDDFEAQSLSTDFLLDVLTTRGDLLFRGASAEQRLAKGSEGAVMTQGADDPEWSNPSRLISNVDMTNGGANDQTSVVTNGLPSWVRWVSISIEGYSQNVNDDVAIQIGPSGGLATTGYVSGRSSDAATRTTDTTQVILNNGTSTVGYTTKADMILVDAANNTWFIFGQTFAETNGAMYFFGGRVSLSGALEQVAVKSAAGTNNFDAGTYNLTYGG